MIARMKILKWNEQPPRPPFTKVRSRGLASAPLALRRSSLESKQGDATADRSRVGLLFWPHRARCRRAL